MRSLIINMFVVLSLGFNANGYARTFKIATLSPDGSFWIITMKAAASDIAAKTE
jgi:hypothetical protein